MTPRNAGGNAGSFRPGPDPRRGTGLPGRAGRRPDAFIRRCADLTAGAVLPKVAAYLDRPEVDPGHSGFRWCAEWLASYAFAKRAPSGAEPMQVEVHADLAHGEQEARDLILRKLAEMEERTKLARERGAFPRPTEDPPARRNGSGGDPFPNGGPR